MVSIFSGLKTLYPGFPHRESGKRKRAGALGCLMMIILQKKMMKIIMVDVYAFPADVDIADHEMRYGFVKRKNWSRVVLIHNLSGVGVSSCQPRGGKCCTGQGSAQTACHRTGEKMCSMFKRCSWSLSFRVGVALFSRHLILNTLCWGLPLCLVDEF